MVLFIQLFECLVGFLLSVLAVHRVLQQTFTREWGLSKSICCGLLVIDAVGAWVYQSD